MEGKDLDQRVKDLDENVGVREGFGPPAAILGSGCEFWAEGKFCDKIATAESTAKSTAHPRLGDTR